MSKDNYVIESDTQDSCFQLTRYSGESALYGLYFKPPLRAMKNVAGNIHETSIITPTNKASKWSKMSSPNAAIFKTFRDVNMTCQPLPSGSCIIFLTLVFDDHNRETIEMSTGDAVAFNNEWARVNRLDVIEYETSYDIFVETFKGRFNIKEMQALYLGDVHIADDVRLHDTHGIPYDMLGMLRGNYPNLSTF